MEIFWHIDFINGINYFCINFLYYLFVWSHLQASLQVEGGTKLELKITWFQAMTFESGLYSLRVSFVFPEDIVPLGTNLASITKVKCMINTGTNDTVEVGSFGNQLKVGTFCLFGLRISFVCFLCIR